MLKRTRAVIFDFDGTLAKVDLDFAVMRARVVELATAMGAAEEPDGTLPVLELMAASAGRLAQSHGPGHGDAFIRKSQKIIRAMEREAAGNGALFPWTRDSMHALAKAGIKVGVITRNCREAVLALFPDIMDHCEVFLSRDDVDRVKPHPDHVLGALAVLGEKPAASVMVGDHFLDVETGHRAGMRTAGVATGRISREELCAAGADMAAPDCGVLVRLLVTDGAARDVLCTPAKAARG